MSKVSGVLRGKCCETCRDISQKKPMKEFIKMNYLTRQMLFRNVYSNFLEIKEIFDEVAVGSRFVLFEVIILTYL